MRQDHDNIRLQSPTESLPLAKFAEQQEAAAPAGTEPPPSAPPVAYTIPAEIKAKIPDYFYYALGGEYVSVSGKDVLSRDADGFSALDYNSSTAGYVTAFKATCKKLDMMWLYEYWDALPWYESDIFDGEIADEVMRLFDTNQGGGTPYYKYLISQNNH